MPEKYEKWRRHNPHEIAHLVINFAVEFILGLGAGPGWLELVLGEELVACEFKGGVCRFGSVESSQNELVLISTDIVS